MALLRLKAESVTEKLKEVLDLAITDSFDSLASFGRMDQKQLEGLKACNELINEANDYLLDQATATDDMCKKLDDLQQDVKELNRKMNLLLEKVERKEVKES